MPRPAWIKCGRGDGREVQGFGRVLGSVALHVHDLPEYDGIEFGPFQPGHVAWTRSGDYLSMLNWSVALVLYMPSTSLVYIVDVIRYIYIYSA